MDLKVIGHATFRGIYDSLRGTRAIFYMDKEINERKLKRVSPTRANAVRQKLDSKDNRPIRKLMTNEESKILKNIMRSAVLNGGIFLMSIIFFEYILLPTIYKSYGYLEGYVCGEELTIAQNVWSWVEAILLLIFKSVWVLPLLFLSKGINTLWCQDIADSAYKYSRGRPVSTQSIGKLLADTIFSFVIQFLFLIQATLVSYIPIPVLGYTLSLVQMCMLYSLYAFEYKWFNMGWELHKRLSFIEANWPYFVGFSLPLSILTQLSSNWVISGCVFAVLFPFFIVSANEAIPIKIPSGYALHMFAPVIYISNILFSRTIGKANSNKNR